MAEGGSMNDPEIDRILSQQDEILPSSGFTAAVMEAVRREAAAPPPIAFPWKRALPGVVAAALALALVMFVGVAAIVQVSRGAISLHVATVAPVLPPVTGQGGIGSVVGWTALALLATLVSVKLSMRLGDR